MSGLPATMMDPLPMHDDTSVLNSEANGISRIIFGDTENVDAAAAQDAVNMSPSDDILKKDIEMDIKKPSALLDSPLLDGGFFEIKRAASAGPLLQQPEKSRSNIKSPSTYIDFHEYPIHDAAALKVLLSQIDMSRFGFGGSSGKQLGSSYHSRENIKNRQVGLALKIPITKKFSSQKASAEDDDYSYEDDDYDYSVNIRNRLNSSLSASNTATIKLKRPKPQSAISLASLSPLDARHAVTGAEVLRAASSSPRSPYKGRHGPHPRCASCHTDKTPYWRDSWNQGFILCNACGLRYSKFKRRCRECNYVPRKEDKNERLCPQCNGQWIQ